jgi:putative membrane protein
MKNIWHIFSGDMKRLVRNPFALIIAIGLCIIPSLYAWFNIYSNWDPYANTKNIKIAVATEDAGYQMDDGTTVNMGDSVIESLKENDKIGWVFTDTKDAALEGVYSGEYYAAVIISSDFTYSMYNVFREDFKRPTISYYENEKKNAVATKITDSAVSTLKQSINEQFIEVLASNIFEQTNHISEQMEENDKFAYFQSKLENLNENLIGYSKMIDTFIAGNGELSQAVAEAKGSIPGLSNKVSDGAKSFGTARSSLDDTKTSLNSFSENVNQTMTSINDSMNRIQDSINATNLAGDAQQTADSLNQAALDAVELQRELNRLQEHLKKVIVEESVSDDDRAVIQKIIETIESINGGATDIEKAISSINQIAMGFSGDSKTDAINTQVSGSMVADAINQSLSDMTQVLTTCSQAIANMQEMYTTSLVPQLNNVIDSMSQMLNNVSDILTRLDDTLGDMNSVFSGIETTVTGANDSLEQIQTVIDGVSEKLTKLLERLNSVEDDEKVQAFIEFMKGDPEGYGEFFSQPVLVTTEEVYPIPNYGSAMTPFYSILAIWVGGTILVALIKVKAEPKDLENVKSYQLFFGRYLLFFVMGQLQALIIVLGDIYILHCQILYPGWFWLVASLASVTFTLLIYSLALSFGDVGKALAVVIMVIQIAGSGGTFPIELLPAVYRNIYIFFPFPYAINAMRETIGGMYGSDYMKNLSELMIFAVVGLLIGLVIRIPFVKLNHFVEKRMEDTKMM